jgi:hypothetical protein
MVKMNDYFFLVIIFYFFTRIFILKKIINQFDTRLTALEIKFKWLTNEKS